MSKYSHDTVVPYQDSELSKKEQVAGMFDQIAFRYDFLNRFLSGGIDRYWRKLAIRELMPLKPAFILDVATGTGDVALMSWKYLRPEKIIGIDISEGMLHLGQQKIAKLLLSKYIELKHGDSEAINFSNNTFDAITVAFGVRNFQNLEQGLKEMLRVLKPGGKVVILEFSKPKQVAFKGIYDLYTKIICPRIGKWLTKNREAYQYLHNSVKAFPEGETFLHILQEVGFSETSLKKAELRNMYNLLWQKNKRLKHIAAVLILLLVSGSSIAQLRELHLPDHDEKKYYLGIGLLYNTARFQVSQHPVFLENDSVLVVSPENTGGFGLAGMHTYRLSRRFEVRAIFPQLLFSYKNLTYNLKYPDASKDETFKMTKKVESILVGLPIHLKFRSDRIENFRVYMFGGVKFEYDLASNARAKRAEELVKLKKIDMGIEAGIGFNFYFPVFILSPEIKISNGLINSHSRDQYLKFSSAIDKLNSRMVVFSLIFEG